MLPGSLIQTKAKLSLKNKASIKDRLKNKVALKDADGGSSLSSASAAPTVPV
jgi:hypothetical protein